ncbi:hypothetical protein [Caulobacter soli]|uniref:hypothetical protein n=1 Tax=Caulobacter soli TaxID=2708539 RepID=UPI0013EC3D34|nr:hypothetical protein [Caulobacter soli]
MFAKERKGADPDRMGRSATMSTAVATWFSARRTKVQVTEAHVASFAGSAMMAAEIQARR